MRDKTDHEVTAMMKAQFMSLWDGKDNFQIRAHKCSCLGPLFAKPET